MTAPDHPHEIDRTQLPSWEVVELNGSGHRLWYVSLLLETAREQRRAVRLTVSPGTVLLPGWREHIEPLVRNCGAEVNVSTESRQQIVRRAIGQGVRLVLPDADRWAGALLSVAVSRGTLYGAALIMRPFAEKGTKSRVRHYVKSCLWGVAASAHPQFTVHRLVPVENLNVRNGLPDPIAFQAPLSGRDEWLARHDLDPSMKWLAILGELSDRKHLREIVEAILSQDAGSSGWGLIAVGTLQKELEGEISRAASLDSGRLVIRRGFVSDHEFDAWIAHADAAAVLHRNEGSSGVLLKCWAAGTAVLAGGSESVVQVARQLGLRGGQLESVTPQAIVEALYALDLESQLDESVPSRQSLLNRNSRFTRMMMAD